MPCRCVNFYIMIILPRCVLPADKSFRLPSPNRPLREPPSCNSRYKVAQSGDAVARELEAHLKTLEQSFSDIDDFFKEQVELPFMYRYIKRDEIQESITRHNQSVKDYILLFSLGVNLSHTAASLQMQQSMHAHQLELVTPA
ncbi:hypothetical protein DFH08DRAFT_444804 [Mycena albidolilacea]|uniref:Uncharacterized protein n=1 Tax=Mycena albidolilacea TaxID=1033008 RepID=A0AAD7EDQ0_9AGAR|nr:hypothetical protein DFH08DRAFT_444804 [Mycena albidolilacea]